MKVRKPKPKKRSQSGLKFSGKPLNALKLLASKFRRKGSSLSDCCSRLGVYLYRLAASALDAMEVDCDARAAMFATLAQQTCLEAGGSTEECQVTYDTTFAQVKEDCLKHNPPSGPPA